MRPANEIKVFIGEIGKAFKEEIINYDQFKKLTEVDFSRSYPAEGVDALAHEMKAAYDEKLIDKAQFDELMAENFATLANGIVSRSALDVPSVPKEKVSASLIEAIASFAPPASGAIASHPVESRPQDLVLAAASSR
ncbi:hypothetical protein [Burkholderia pyrrocinia]